MLAINSRIKTELGNSRIPSITFRMASRPNDNLLFVTALHLVEKAFQLLISVHREGNSAHDYIAPREYSPRFFLFLHSLVHRISQADVVIWRETFDDCIGRQSNMNLIDCGPLEREINRIDSGIRRKPRFVIHLENMHWNNPAPSRTGS